MTDNREVQMEVDLGNQQLSSGELIRGRELGARVRRVLGSFWAWRTRDFITYWESGYCSFELTGSSGIVPEAN